MFLHYEDNEFKKIIDDFILSSTNDELSPCAIRNIDNKALKLGISFYQMMFMLIQNDSIENMKKRMTRQDLG
jgi:hypothetical protein